MSTVLLAGAVGLATLIFTVLAWRGTRLRSGLTRAAIERADPSTQRDAVPGVQHFVGAFASRTVIPDATVQRGDEYAPGSRRIDEAFRAVQEDSRRVELQFRELAEAMPQIVYVTDRRGSIEFVNARWKIHTGLDSAESDVLSQVVHPEDLPILASAWQTAMSTERELAAEFRLRNVADQTYRWFLTRATPSRDESGAVVRWYGTSTDIEELRAARQALEESDRRKDEFLATLAHELRNPMAPLRNAVSILKMSTTQKELPWALDLIDRQLHQITRLIDDLMDVSRINEGKLQMQIATLDLRSVVHAAVEMCDDIVAAGKHTVTIEEPSQPIAVEGDSVRLVQTVVNLITNAVKYSDAGTSITIRALAAGDSASIQVEDHGIGIPPQQLESIFGMFTQVSHSAYRERGGLGIGLSLVQRLVHLHSGTVKAHSDGTGTGSTFTITLPIGAPKECENPVISVTPEPAALRSLRILLVDDNVDAVSSLAALLEQRGATVQTASHGLEVVPAAIDFTPDVIVLDIGLPGADGYEVCRMIRSESWGRQLPMIALTGWGHENDRTRAKQAGFDRHVVKPAHPDDLMTVIGELVAPP